MSDDRTWYPGDPYSGAGADGGDAGYRGRRGSSDQNGGQNNGPNGGRNGGRRGQDEQAYDPYARDPRYGRQPPSGSPNNYGRPGQGQYDPSGQYDRSNPYDRSGGRDRRDGSVPNRTDRPGGGAPPPRDPYSPNARPAAPWGPPAAPRGGPGPQGDAWVPGSDSPGRGRGDYAAPAAGYPQRDRAGADQGTDGGRGHRGRTAAAGYGAGGRTPTDGIINRDLDLDELDPTGRARGGAARGRAGKKKRSRGRTIFKWTSLGMALVLVAGLSYAGYIYETTVGNFKHTPLLPKGETQAALPPDPYGDTAMNILLIGSDTRDTAEDCTLGGDCSGSAAGANADAEIILHVAANRSNATILSIPRDTEATIPHCSTDSSGNVTITGHFQGQINSALQDGPECQVAADHDLTGITITGYILFDFSGVVAMSNALGGVPVCVTKAVHDKNSGLTLPAGVSDVQGNIALEFLRTRDSFFDGSDLGREMTTHYFFTQMIQTMRTKMNFSSLPTLIRIGQAAASSTTVSDNFAGLGNLEGLVESLNKIPTDAITMVTMPWELDPTNLARVQPNQPDANAMFKNIQNDVSYTNNAPATGPTATTAPAIPAAPVSVVKSQVSVNVVNGDGVTGRAGTIATALQSAGFTRASTAGDTSTPVATTVVDYPAGYGDQADAVAAALKIPAAQVLQSSTYSKVTIIVGSDFVSGTAYVPVTTAGNTAGAASAPTSAGESNADSTGECIPVESGTLTMAHQ